jgi:hypothetical protein
VKKDLEMNRFHSPWIGYLVEKGIHFCPHSMVLKILFNGFSGWKRVGRGDYFKRSTAKVIAGPENRNVSATNEWKKTCSDRCGITTVSPAAFNSKSSPTPQPSTGSSSVNKDVVFDARNSSGFTSTGWDPLRMGR